MHFFISLININIIAENIDILNIYCVRADATCFIFLFLYWV